MKQGRRVYIYILVLSAVLAVCVALLLFAQNNGKSGKQPVLSPTAGLTNSPDAEPTGPVYTFVMTNTANGTIVTQTDTLPYAWHTFSLNETALRKGQETVVVEEFPGLEFSWQGYEMTVTENGKELLRDAAVHDVFFDDLDGDGSPEFCFTGWQGSGIHYEVVHAFDMKNRTLLSVRTTDLYFVELEDKKITVIRRATPASSWEPDMMEDAVWGHFSTADGKLAYVVDRVPEDPPSMEISLAAGEVRCWKDANSEWNSIPRRVVVSNLPGYEFILQNREFWYQSETDRSMRFTNVYNAFFADLNGDGCPEWCLTTLFSDIYEREHGIIVYDVKNRRNYILNSNSEDYSFCVRNGVLAVRIYTTQNREEVFERAEVALRSLPWKKFAW